MFLAIALLAATASQASNENDTTLINNAHKVIIITGDSLQTVKVMGKEADSKYVYENSIQLVDTNYVSETRTYRDLKSIGWNIGPKDKCGRRSVELDLTLNFGLGISAPTNVPEPLSLRPFKSWDGMIWLQLNNTPKRHPLQTYSIGFGLTVRRYGLRDGQMFQKDADGTLRMGNFPEHASDRHSSITITSLSVPLFLTHKFGAKSHFKLTLGPVVNFNIGGSISSGYEIGDNEHDITTRGIGYRPVTVDFMGILRTYGVGFFFKYSPQSVLKSGRGPQFHALSFGLFF